MEWLKGGFVNGVTLDLTSGKYHAAIHTGCDGCDQLDT